MIRKHSEHVHVLRYAFGKGAIPLDHPHCQLMTDYRFYRSCRHDPEYRLIKEPVQKDVIAVSFTLTIHNNDIAFTGLDGDGNAIGHEYLFRRTSEEMQQLYETDPSRQILENVLDKVRGIRNGN